MLILVFKECIAAITSMIHFAVWVKEGDIEFDDFMEMMEMLHVNQLVLLQ